MPLFLFFALLRMQVQNATGTNVANKTQLTITLLLGVVIGLASAWQVRGNIGTDVLLPSSWSLLLLLQFYSHESRLHFLDYLVVSWYLHTCLSIAAVP